MNGPAVRVMAFGDSAVLVVVGDRLDPAVTQRVHRVSAALGDAFGTAPGYSQPVPGAASVLVGVDPVDPGVNAAIKRIEPIVAGVEVGGQLDWEAPTASRVPIELPTRYGGPDGPDLEAVAARNGLTPAEVIAAHASVEYEVQFLGFAPGFAYLGELPATIAAPRHTTPRTRVPAGSVGIAGRQTAVYPFDSPGGWQIVGRTDARLWDIDREPPALLVPGATVRFVPID